MRQLLLVVVLVGLVVGACTDRRKEAIEKIGHDEEVIKKASGAVNEVIRNSTDCETAKSLIPEARQRIEEARAEVSAPATQATLDALSAQVDRVAQACP
jgi:hypothetical protein